MPFGSYKSISDVANAFRITYAEAAWGDPLPHPAGEPFRSELAFVLKEVDFSNSEFSVCENLIYPVLKEVWKPYTGSLMLWGHQPLVYDEDLSGVPDYLVAKRSPLGKVVRGSPHMLLVVEAKKDNFEEGWGQCLAALVAAQKLNQPGDQVVYGVVSNGRVWELGQLHAALFSREVRLFTLQDLDGLFAALNYLFARCKEQVLSQPLTV